MSDKIISLQELKTFKEESDKALDKKVSILDNAINAEEARALLAESGLQAQLDTRVTSADILALFNTSGNEIVDETMELTEADNISDNTLELNIGTNSQIVNNKLVLE